MFSVLPAKCPIAAAQCRLLYDPILFICRHSSDCETIVFPDDERGSSHSCLSAVTMIMSYSTSGPLLKLSLWIWDGRTEPKGPNLKFSVRIQVHPYQKGSSPARLPSGFQRQHFTLHLSLENFQCPCTGLWSGPWDQTWTQRHPRSATGTGVLPGQKPFLLIYRNQTKEPERSKISRISTMLSNIRGLLGTQYVWFTWRPCSVAFLSLADNT